MSQKILENNKRIAKNTMALYLRMFFIMGISLYTSRVILANLGVDDFGTYNVVGGIVVLFTFVNNAMVSATQRYMNFELGQHNHIELKRVFSMSLNIHMLIAIMVLVLGESVGLFILYNYINIPENSIYDAEIIFHLSLLSTIFNIIRAPYNACIIAYEKMSVFSYLSIFESLAKLGIAWGIGVFNENRLVLYALLMTIVSILLTLFYYIYCRINFETCKYIKFWDAALFKNLTSFSGWSLFGNVAMVAAFQGVSIVQNYFSGVIVNAAMGIANQVNAAIYGFSSNFQMAFNPQITKYYASKEYVHLRKLTYIATKTSFFLVWIIAFPLIVCCSEVLSIWLEQVPMYAVEFCQLIMLSSLFDALSAPLWMNVQATGQIRKYQMFISILILFNLPLSILVLSLGYNPISVLIVRLFISIACFLYRCFYAQKNKLVDISSYMYNAILPCFMVVLFSIALFLLIRVWVSNMFIIGGLAFICCFFLVLFIGFTKRERDALFVMVQKKI